MPRPPFVISAAAVPEKQHQYPNSDEKMAPGRAIGDPYWGIGAVPGAGYARSVLVVWDYGASAPPETATPPSAGNDPHAAGTGEPRVVLQALRFLEGAFVDVCGGGPCRSTAAA